jgi:hypothetical protein
MKRKAISLSLVAALLLSLFPAALAASTAPSGFLQPVGLALPEARSSGLIEEPDTPLPDPNGSGFLGSSPIVPDFPAAGELPGPVGEPDPEATPISTAQELAAMKAGGNYVLTADIDLSGVEWTPLAIRGNLALDGQGHTISGGTCGLLNFVTEQLTVKNLILSSFQLSSVQTVQVSAGTYAADGALVRAVTGAFTAENCSVENLSFQRGSTGQAVLGGLASYAKACSITQCTVTGTVDMDAGETAVKTSDIGGLVGYASDALLTGCLAKVDISANGLTSSSSNGVGGLVGHTLGDATFRDCYYEGTVSASGSSFFVGGLVGYLQGGADFDNCSVSADLSGQDLGGLVGYASASAGKTLRYTDCRFSGSLRQALDSNSISSVYGAGGLAGYVGDGFSTWATNCAVKLQLSSDYTSSGSRSPVRHLGGLVGYADCPSSMEGCAFSVTGAISGKKGFQFAGLAAQTGDFTARDCAGNLTLTTDPEGDFSSEGHYVGGLVGSCAEAARVELTNCGSLVDVTLAGSGGSATSPTFSSLCAGGLVGQAPTVRLRQCWADGQISLPSNNYASDRLSSRPLLGGLVGYAQDLSAVQCYSGCDLAGTTYASGGFVGTVGLYKSNNSSSHISATSATFQSCWSDGICASAGEYSGGLVGCFYTKTNAPLAFLDCYADHTAPLPSGLSRGSAEYSGGLVGYAMGSRLSMDNCYTEFDQMAGAYSGGLAGSLAGPYTRISFCSASGHKAEAGAILSTNSSYSGGLVGHLSPYTNGPSRIENCQFTGSVLGSYAGGICGIAYDTTISNCQVRLTSRPYTYFGQITEYLGGIAGALYNSAAVDCSVSGLSASRNTSSDLSSTTYKTILYVGGIAGTMDSEDHLERCQVTGDLRISTEGRNSADIYVGGLAGKASGTAIKNTQFTGDILLSAAPLNNTALQHTFYTGGLFGHDGSGTITLEATFHNSSVTLSAPSSFGKLERHSSEVGYHSWGTLEWAKVPSIVLPETEEETYTVTALGIDPQTLRSTPLPGASVSLTLNGAKTTKTTDDNGVAVFTGNALSSQGLATISATGPDDTYFKTETWALLADGGHTNVYLTAKQAGKIYIQSATVLLNGQPCDVLSGANTVWIPQLDSTARPVYVGIDWNDIQEEGRSVKLVDEDGEDLVSISANQSSYLVLPECFDADEKIYVVASGTGTDGTPCQTKQLLNLKVKAIDVSLPVPEGKQTVDTGEDGLYFLKGLGVNLNLGDLAGISTKMSYKNGVLTLEFSGKDTDKKNMSVWTGFSEKVSVSGSVKIPITDAYQGEWSGTVKVAINQSVNSNVSNSSVNKYNKDQKDSHRLTYNFLLFGVPCFLETGLSVEGSASMSLYGPYDSVYFKGDITAGGSGTLFGGVGGSLSDDVELKFGGQGKLETKIPMKFNNEAANGFSLDPSISGTLSAKATLKAYILDLSAEIKLGGFTWDKNGARWNSGDLAALSADETSWAPMGRAYLANGGGFQGGGGLSVLDFNPSASSQLRYENIFSGSNSALTVQDGLAVLYYTADDGRAPSSGQAADHTALYRSVRQADGSWGTPVQISTVSSYPALPAADGAFAVWVESSDTSDLEALLSSTSIQVAKDGEIIHTIPGGGYGYAPQISVSEDGQSALVCWLSNPAVTAENLLGTGATLCYASYQDGTWTTGQVKTGQSVTSAVPDCDTAAIVYKGADGSLYKASGKNFATSTLWIPSVGRYATDGSLAAFFQQDGSLAIQSGTSIQAVVETSFSGSENPVLLSDGSSAYVLWTEADGIRYTTNASGSWCQPLLLSSAQQLPTGLSAALIDGLPLVSYLLEQNGQTDLYTALPTAQGVDLVLTGLSYDPQDLAQRGVLTLQVDLFNNGLTPAETVELVITDEGQNEVYRIPMADGNSAAVPVASGAEANLYPAFVPDPSCIHTYTVTVAPLSADGSSMGDADPADNTLSIQVGTQAASVADASFSLDPEGNCSLQALVCNSGSVTLSQLDLLIYASDTTGAPLGEPLAQQQFDSVPAGSCRQLLLEGITSNSYYMIAAATPEGEILDTALVCYSDPNAAFLQVQSLSVPASGAAALSLLGQNLDLGTCQLLLALYRDGQMVTCGSVQAESLAGPVTLSLPLADPIVPGRYDYRLFLLSPDQTYRPQLKSLSGTVTVE